MKKENANEKSFVEASIFDNGRRMEIMHGGCYIELAVAPTNHFTLSYLHAEGLKGGGECQIFARADKWPTEKMIKVPVEIVGKIAALRDVIRYFEVDATRFKRGDHIFNELRRIIEEDLRPIIFPSQPEIAV